jgi:hypothetical protein
MPTPTQTSIVLAALALAAGAAHGAAIDRTLYAIGVNPNTGNQALVRFDPDNPSDEEYIGELGITLPEFNVFLSYNPDEDAFFASSDDEMYRVDRYTGLTTQLNVTGAARLQGSAYVPAIGGTIVAHTNAGDAGFLDRRLSSVDPITGALTPLADFNGGALSGLQEFDEVAYDAASGYVVAYDYQLAEYHEIDPATWLIVGTSTLVGTPAVFRGDINPANGDLYYNDVAVVQGPGGTEFNGLLDIWVRDLPGHALIGTTGSITLLEKIDGLAFVPAPGAAPLLGLAALAAVRRRR